MSNSTELDYADQLVKSAIYAPDHYSTVITLACALTHKIDDVDSAPRILALGLKGSGKSTILKVSYRLAANATPPTGVKAMTAPSYVADFRMNPRTTHDLDEVNHLFGETGSNGKNSQFYTYLNQGYLRDTAYAQYQENKVKLQIPIFGVVFMAGLGLAAPEDLRDRSIIMKMEAAPEKVEVADFSLKETKEAFDYGGRMLRSWAERAPKLDLTACRGLHPKLNHRVMEVWGPLFAVALAADGDDPENHWVKRTLVAFERIELNSGVPVYAPEDQILLDYLDFHAECEPSDAVPSGAFAAYATSQNHGAYQGMKPGQFRQFAVKILGPTVPYYDDVQCKMVRGWSDIVHKMNIEHAINRKEELETARADETTDDYEWEDF
jgi:hypothetical protein